nr:glutaminase [Bacillus shivajii]
MEEYKSQPIEGQCATYIPALGKANPSDLGICIIEPDQTTIKAGNCDVPFSLQSVSKVISFMATCIGRGTNYVLDRVDVEPTGDAFNSIVRLEMHNSGRPFNPMINAGAITVSSILPGDTPQNKIDYLFSFIQQITGKTPSMNLEVFQSEWNTANRNRALAYYLKETGYLELEVDEALEVYLKQCSIEVDSEDLALIGLVISLDGYHPFLKEQVIPKKIAKLAKALMLTCGMYNASGKFAAFVGVPAKSGVSGGIMTSVIPRPRSMGQPFQNGCGIGIYGPAIDDYGNSVAGVKLLKTLADEWDLSIF